MKPLHVGLFDSGVGGLTLLKELAQHFPMAKFTYLGDTANFPYGSKHPSDIARYSASCTNHLISQGVDCVVVACGTASSAALDALKKRSPVPVLGIIEPTIHAALRTTKTHAIGIIATQATIASQAFQRGIRHLAPHVTVIAHATPLLAPLVEKGLHDHPTTDVILQNCASLFTESNIDTLILGSTHYPVLAKALQKAFGEHVSLISHGHATADALRHLLQSQLTFPLHSPEEERFRFFVTGDKKEFAAIGEGIFEKPLCNLEVTSLCDT